MTTNSNIRIGTVIHGTLRTEDLLEAFADELERISDDDSHKLLILEARAITSGEDVAVRDDDEETASDIVSDLIDALNEYAPIHCYFGALEGDGSDFGFWPTGDDWDNCSGHWVSKHEFIDHDCRVFVQINDHGNITVSELRGKEIWSAV